MGSCISLDADCIQLDWGKNEYWQSHAALFQPGDFCDDPDEPEEDDEPYTGYCGGYERTLSRVRGRLDLLGYSCDACRAAIGRVLKSAEPWEISEAVSETDLLEVIHGVDLDLVGELRAGWLDYTCDWEARQRELASRRSELRVRSGLEDVEETTFGELLRLLYLDLDWANDRYALDPYLVLRLLCERDDRDSRLLTWYHSDLVEGGWAEPADFEPNLAATQRILIVTEGTQDAAVLESAIQHLRPDVADFFYFVDMEKKYPFTGTGNLYRFTQGLASIGIQNKVVVVYDNDAEGRFNHERTLDLERPPNLGAMRLPDLDVFRHYPTIGPAGEGREDINGRAVSIELFLDDADSASAPPVRWRSYHDGASSYHGVVENKDEIVKRFLSSAPEAHSHPRLLSLVESVIAEATRVSVAAAWSD